MKIVHLSDTHLGFRQLQRTNNDGRNEREQDIYDAFNAAIERAIELAPAAVVHAGDLFDSYHPSSTALGVALDGLARLRAVGIPFVVIAGNHSTPRVRAADHVFAVLARFDGGVGLIHAVHGSPRTVRLAEGQLAVHAVPHHNDPEILAGWLRDARPDSDAQFNVLVAHTGLDGLGQFVGSEAALELPGEILSEAGDFDYVALGHLHKHRPARDNAAYAGSLERLSWGDDAREKGVVEVDLAAGRHHEDYVHLRTVPTRTHVELDPVDAASASDLTSAIIARAEGIDLSRAMVRLEVRNVTAPAWSAVDRKAIDQAFAGCLHFQLEPTLVGGESVSSAPSDLREFLLAWPGSKAPGQQELA
jgi:DNA repair protein SbcD/Mre11